MTVGKTRDAGWQIGVSRTVPVERGTVWRFLLGPGLPLWLGTSELGSAGSTYEGPEATGEVRGRKEDVRIRVTHRPTDGRAETTIQIALRDAARGTTIVFHQERLAGPEQREQARSHWKAIAGQIEAELLDER